MGGCASAGFSPYLCFQASLTRTCVSPHRPCTGGLGTWFPGCQGDLALPALQVARTLGDAGGRSKPSERSDLGEAAPTALPAFAPTEKHCDPNASALPWGIHPTCAQAISSRVPGACLLRAQSTKAAPHWVHHWPSGHIVGHPQPNRCGRPERPFWGLRSLCCVPSHARGSPLLPVWSAGSPGWDGVRAKGSFSNPTTQ